MKEFIERIKITRLINHYLYDLIRTASYMSNIKIRYREGERNNIIFAIDNNDYIVDTRFRTICDDLDIEYDDTAYFIIINTINKMYNTKGEWCNY